MQKNIWISLMMRYRSFEVEKRPNKKNIFRVSDVPFCLYARHNIL